MIFSGVGRLTRDCEVKQAGQSTVCKFNIACNDNYSKDKTHFFYLNAGQKVAGGMYIYNILSFLSF